MKRSLFVVWERPVVAALLLVGQGLSGCSAQAPDGKAGGGRAAPVAAQPGVDSTRKELVVGFLPVT